MKNTSYSQGKRDERCMSSTSELFLYYNGKNWAMKQSGLVWFVGLMALSAQLGHIVP